jgi:rod shape-determining protein MreB
MANVEFAIELGTTSTTIYKKGSGIVLIEPSLVAKNINGKKTVVKAVGYLAKKMQGKTANNTIITSPIKDGVIEDSKHAQTMLKYFIKKVMPKKLFKQKVKILFVVPCGLTVKEKTLYKNVAYNVGASKVEFVPSVIASLVGSGVNTKLPNGVISLNLGGGTFSVASVSLNTIIAGYTISIGGEKMDQAIKAYVKETYELEISLQTAEKIKQEIGSLYIHDNSNMEVSGIDTSTKSPRQDVVTSSNVRPAIEHYFDKIVSAIEDVLNNCSPDIVADISNNGVYITGGLASLTGIENYFKKRLRLPIIMSDKPEEACIIGAGKLLSDKKALSTIIKEN